MNRHERIRRQLDNCVEHGVLRGYYAQGNMPGKRWHVEGVGTFSSRAFSTNEVEAFLLGVAAAGIEVRHAG